ncbi:AcrR family transcriptional regulator [Mycobacterium sp. MAA66]|uniref:ScbR family autoregulator-binding transcription factor n=1 Tax=Mycobacterium sp. MAA66 TaxID=3156297 RepID=UPI0035182CDD
MARQSRSEVTRRKIIDSAVDLINEIGYPAAGLADIIERAELTKGALYYHFDSKEALATVIIEEAMTQLLNVFQAARDSGLRALESLILGTYETSDLLANNRTARAGTRLLRTFDGLNPASKFAYENFSVQFGVDMRKAAEQGDLRSDIDLDQATESLVAATLGIEVLSSALTSWTDMHTRFDGLWNMVLPAIVTPESLDGYLTFLATMSTRTTSPAEPDAP